MSAKGRGGKRRANDDYPTPPHAIRAILPEVNARVMSMKRPPRILEPACGEGAIIREMIKNGYDRKSFTGIELNGRRARKCRESLFVRVNPWPGFRHDFLQHAWYPEWDLIITNPPFSHAQRFFEHAIRSLAPGGVIFMLLRLAFIEAQERQEFHDRYPTDFAAFSKRPGFLDTTNRTDMAAYAWFSYPGTNRWRVLDAAPSNEQVTLGAPQWLKPTFKFSTALMTP